jgi:hypothetical protein
LSKKINTKKNTTIIRGGILFSNDFIYGY